MYFPEFVDIYKHDSFYLAEGIIFLKNNNDTNWSKQINFYAMQNLSLLQYLQFYKVYIEQFEQKKINEDALKEATIPHFLKYQIIVRNYNNPQVANLLNSLLVNDDLSDEFKKFILDIKSGKILKEMKNDDPEF